MGQGSKVQAKSQGGFIRGLACHRLPLNFDKKDDVYCSPRGPELKSWGFGGPKYYKLNGNWDRKPQYLALILGPQI